MATIHQINRLNARIDEIEEKFGLTVKPTYEVTLEFGNDGPSTHDPRVIRLSFGTGAEKFVRIPRPD